MHRNKAEQMEYSDKSKTPKLWEYHKFSLYREKRTDASSDTELTFYGAHKSIIN